MPTKQSFKERAHKIVFETNTPAGKLFDVVLLVLIMLSIVVVSLESVDFIKADFPILFLYIEWCFTVLFTIEYLVRIWLVERPRHYVFSFYGMIDFLSVLPSYLSLFMVGTQPLLILRSFRLLRVFRVFKLGRYLGESTQLMNALKASRAKIIVFVSVVMTVALIMGTLMYMVEGAENGFTSIPRSFYWAVVTMTTVGYGDIAPQTILGQGIAAILMMLGYGIIAVPTGIVTVEYNNTSKTPPSKICQACDSIGHDKNAIHCKFCGSKL